MRRGCDRRICTQPIDLCSNRKKRPLADARGSRNAAISGDRATKSSPAREQGDALGLLPQLILYLFQPIRPLQHFARLAAVRWTYDAFALHHVENPRRTAVT